MGLTLTEACLAIDAGNSKTDVAVVAADGTVLGSARGGGFQPPTVGVEAAVGDLARTVERAARIAAARVGDRDGPGDPEGPGDGPGEGSSAGPGAGPGAGPRFAHVSACLANADLPREEEELEAALSAYAWGRTTHVANDTFAILRAGLPDDGTVRHGVAVVCGAGVNCVGQDAQGRTHRFPAVGQLSGDWGGGSGLADEALYYAARAEDGRGDPTELARVLPAHFGLPSMYALIEALHLRDMPAERKHEITPLLFSTASEGDPVALALVNRQADEIVSLVTVTLTRLDLLGTRTPVFLGGSIAAARHPLLDDRITRRLAIRAPEAVTDTVTAPPVLGAALLGLDRTGADKAAYGRLRAQYA